MGGSKTKQQQTQQQQFNNVNTYGFETPPDTADIAAMRNFQFQSDPRLPHTFARARQGITDVYANPLGGATTPQLRDAVMRASFEDIGQQESQAQREENFGRQGLEFAKTADVAALTQPRLVQRGGSGSSSGSSSGTSTSSQSPINSIVQGGSAIGSALLM